MQEADEHAVRLGGRSLSRCWSVWKRNWDGAVQGSGMGVLCVWV